MKIIPYLLSLIIYIAKYANETSGKKSKISQVKAFKNFKSLKRMLKAISATQTAAAIIEEIGTQDHQEKWEFSYYDRKFSLIGGQLNSFNKNLNEISNYIDQIDQRISSNKWSTIATSTLAFICILGSFILGIMLLKRTNNNSYQKRMENLLKVVKATREEAQQRLNVLNARQDLEQMQNSNNEIRQGINSLQSNA